MSSEEYERMLGARPTDFGLDELVRRIVREEIANDRQAQAVYRMLETVIDETEPKAGDGPTTAEVKRILRASANEALGELE